MFVKTSEGDTEEEEEEEREEEEEEVADVDATVATRQKPTSKLKLNSSG